MTILNTLATKLDASPLVVNNWRDGWKMLSVRFNALGIFLNVCIASAVQAFYAAPVYVLLGIHGTLILITGIFIAGIIGRLLTQDSISNK